MYKSRAVTKPIEFYQIKVTLRDSQPPIWRRIQVRSDTTLAKLHKILQCVMGWEDAHLHRFTIQGERYGVPDEENVGPRKTRDERKYKLGDVMPGENSQCTYLYDFGDNWEHVLVVEKVLPAEDKVACPICLDGARACPPEDVGGIGRYDDFLHAITDPAHPEHEEFTEWIGDTFDPEGFHVNEVNQKLRAIR
jgi:Plasmid pRiA4b ORF-3-like protein